MQAIILAAGRGNRLSPITDKVPKPLVEVNGTPLIINALNALSRHKPDRFIIVVGYCADLIEKRLGQSHNGVEIVYVENEDWHKTNNIHSLWLTKHLWDRNSILLECDVFFEASLIDELMTQPFENLVMVDRFEPHMDGTVVEISDDMKIRRMIPGSDQDENFNFTDKYKTVNIYTFTEQFLREFFRPTLELYVQTVGQNEYYELVLGMLVFMGKKDIKAKICAPHRWFEIDDFTDLTRAEARMSDPKTLLEKVRKSYGGYWRYDFTDFEYLYNPYFPPQSLLNELRVNLADLLGNYPSGQEEINHGLANWAQVDESMLAVANGASELITALSRRIKKVTLLQPGFAEYERGLTPEQINSLMPNPLTLTHSPLAVVKETLASRSNALVLVNPNNPTGARFTLEQLRFIITSLRSLDMIVLDESFADFISASRDSTMMDELAAHPNLVILRSLSKDLGVPGIRLGYIASSNRALIREVRSELPIWHINSMAQYFIDILPKYRSDYAASREQVLAAREEMGLLLEEVPNLKTYPSFANYFCCELPAAISSAKLQQELFLNHRLLIKDLGRKCGLTPDRFIRIAVKTPEENRRLVLALAETLASFGYAYQAA